MSELDKLKSEYSILETRVRQLVKSDVKLRSLLENLSDVVWETDPQGNFTFLSGKLEEVTGFQPEDLLGKSCMELVCEDQREEVGKTLWELGKAWKPFKNISFWGKRKDGQRIYQVLNAGPVKNEDGSLKGYVGITSDETRRKNAELALVASEARNRAILRSLPDMLFILDREGTFLDFVVYEDVDLILPRDQLVGSRITDLPLSPESLENVYRGIEKALDTGEIATSEYWFEEDALKRFYEARYTPLDSKSVLAVQREVTSEKRMQEDLKRAKERAEAASGAKTRFLANLSHEIRTPMSGIIGMTQLAMSTGLNSEQSFYLNMVLSSANSLLAIINDILDVSKIEAGKLEKNITRFNLCDMLTETLLPLTFTAGQKNLEINAIVDPALPECIGGDRGRLRQIMVNLVGNAVKFSSEGDITVEARLVEEPAPDGTFLVEFEVRDRGIGIPANRIKDIFAPFTQVDESLTRKHQGTGLGLTISRNLVEFLGGTIWVESKEDKGSSFFFTASVIRYEDDEAFEYGPCKNQRILVVDDCESARESLRVILQKWEVTVDLAADIPQAINILELALAENAPVSMVFTDTDLASEDGFDLVNIIRSHPHLGHLPVVMLTSPGNRLDYEKCTAMGLNHILAKPFHFRDVCSLIQAAATPGHQLYRQTTDPVSQAQRSSRELTVLIAEDNLVNQKLSQILLSKMGHHTYVADNGREALRLYEEVSPNIILMDVQMPIMDGFEATMHIRERERETGVHTPIVGLTANAMQGDRELCLSKGMDYYVAKPIRLDNIHELVEAIILEHVSGNIPAFSHLPSIDLKSLRERFEDDMDLLGDLLEIYEQDDEEYMDGIELALKTRDSKLLRQKAHTIKGAIANFDAPKACEIAATLESMGSRGVFEQGSALLALLRRENRRFKSRIRAITSSRNFLSETP